MKSALLVLGLSALAGTLGYTAFYKQEAAKLRAEVSSHQPELEWLHRKFHLGPDQFEQIRKLEAAYAPRCEQLTASLAQADAEAARMIAAHATLTPEVQAALDRCQEVHTACQREALEHVYAVSALMPKEEAQHYVQNMLPSILEPGATPKWVVHSESPR